MRYAINNYGLPKPLFLTSASSIRYNPFTAHLTIRDLEVRLNEKNSALKLPSLNAELSLHQLLFDKIYVSEFNVNGLYIPVTVNESSLNIAGFELRSETAEPLTTEPEAEEDSVKTNFPYQVIIPKLSLTEATIELRHFSQQHNIQLDSFSLENILLSKDEQDIKLTLISQLDGAPIAVAIDAQLLQQQGEISVDLHGDNIALNSAQAFLPASISALDGKLSYAGKIAINIGAEQTSITSNEFMLSIDELDVGQDNMSFNVQGQKLRAQALMINLQADNSVSVNAILDYVIDDVVAKTTDNASLLALEGKLSYTGDLALNVSAEQTSANIKESLLSIDELHLEQNNISLDVQRQQLHTNELAIILAADQPISVNAMLDYGIEGVLAKTKDNSALFAEIANLSINSLALKFQENIASVQIESVGVASSQFSKNLHQDLPALAAFNQLTVNNVEYTPELIAMNSISISGLIANVLLDKDKNLATLVNLHFDKAKSPDEVLADSDKLAIEQAQGTEISTPAVKPVFRLGQFSILDAAQVDFRDSSVRPNYLRNVRINQLLLSAVDTSKPEQEVTLNIQGISDKYANFDIKGRGLPFAKEQSFQVDAVVKELSLPGISSYIKQALKYEIESGQLDLTIAAGLTGNKLNGDVDLLLRGIEFTAADDHETGSLKDTTSVPFNVALGMLKDSDGNVELSLPLKGDTSSPSFGFSGFLTLLVKQATMSAAKDYLLTTFVPYASVLKVAMAAGEYALKLRVNDLDYAPGETELNEEQLEFSRQMSVMLADRGAINVKLCAIATASDIDLTDVSLAQEPENIARLKAISEQRVDSFKAHMVEQLKVPSARLLFCTPQIDTSKGAKSRIKFVI